MVSLVSCGAINWDITLYVEQFARPGEEVRVLRIDRIPGGTGANVAVAAARILGPGEVAFVGAVGDDEMGGRHFEILRDEGVYTGALKVVKGVESGQAYIVVDESGRNIIHTFFGANLSLTPQDVESPETLRVLREARVVVVMDPPLETAFRLIKKSRQLGKTVVWDPGVYVDEGLEALREGLKFVDYLILNELEYRELLQTDVPSEACRRLSEVNPSIRAVVKMGSKGAAVSWNRGLDTVYVEAFPLEKVGMKVVNTVGCGDAFIGAFASAKALGLGDEEALLWADCAGAFKATRPETRGSPTRSELEWMVSKARELGLRPVRVGKK